MAEEKSLFQQGYRIQPCWIPIVRENHDYDPCGYEHAGARITNPKGETYLINACEGNCSCKGYEHRKYCKHLRGLVQLLIDQAALWAEQRRILPPINLSPIERQLLHEGRDPIYVLGSCSSARLEEPRVHNYARMNIYEQSEWGCLSLAANLKGHDWAMPDKFVAPENPAEGDYKDHV